MNLQTAKGICIVVQFTSSFIIGCFPYLLVRGKGSSPRHVRIREAVISYLKCFSGGVFMAACLLNLLPEGMEAMEEYFRLVNIKTDYPVYLLMTALGFFIIALVEQLAQSLINRNYDNYYHETRLEGGTEPHTTVTDDIPHSQGTSSNQTSEIHFDTAALSKGTVYYDARLDSNTAHEHSHSNTSEIKKIGSTERSINSGISTLEKDSDASKLRIKSAYGKRVAQLPKSQADSTMSESYAAGQNASSISRRGTLDPHSEMHEIMEVIDVQEHPLQAFLLLAALSFHTIFDGMAVGLTSNVTDMWQMMIAIIIHKSLVSICLGIELFVVFRNRPCPAVLWTLFFSLVAPFGIGIGMLLNSDEIDEVSKQLANSFLQAIATGTFLYVTLFEILKDELVNKTGFHRIFLVMTGFACMGLAKYLSDSLYEV